MTHLPRKLASLSAIAIILILSSCTKSTLQEPIDTIKATNAKTSNAILLTVSDSIVGRYRITRYIDNGKNETSKFKGYAFQFQSDGKFIARTDSKQIVIGSWVLDSTGTTITINISGTGSLNNLVGDWQIINVTSTQIILANTDG